MTQIQSPGMGVIKAYSNARKLFQVSKLPVGVMSYGLGNIGNRSIQSFVREFDDQIKAPVGTAVPAVAQALYEFIDAAYAGEFTAIPKADRPVLGFYVAGYSPKKVFAEEWEFRLPIDTKAREVRAETMFGAAWRGIEIPFTRLYFGLDPRMADGFKAAGLTDAQIQQIVQPWQSPVVYDGMPVQDAVNFVAFIVQTTVGMATFEVGVPACGGPIQVATILPGAEFNWIANPRLAVSEN